MNVEKIIKFLSLENAIHEVFLELADNPYGWFDLALFAKVYGFLTKGTARPGTRPITGPIKEERGIWFKSSGAKKERFIRKFDFRREVDKLIPELISKGDDIVQVYQWTMWVNASLGKRKNGEDGIWIETEMEKFHCAQCGNCCLDLSGAIQTTVNIADINRWRSEERGDILQWVVIYDFAGETAVGDIWISPNTGEDATRCPWLRKVPKQEKYKCLIHDTKPAHCRNYPKSKRHALATGCKGFGDDLTFERVKHDLEKFYN